jgi:hypothetical protein
MVYTFQILPKLSEDSEDDLIGPASPRENWPSICLAPWQLKAQARAAKLI